MSPIPTGAENEEFWRDYLTRGSGFERRARHLFVRMPHGPRCKLCAAPFHGVGGPLMRMIGKSPSDQSPQMCRSCFTFLARHHGGAEVELSLLFADIRGSTTLAEAMPAREYHALLDRFFTTASEVVFQHDGGIDKFVGDELVAFFFPLISGEQHAARAVETGVALLRATGHADAGSAWVPVGAGVHTGRAWMGAVGEGAHTELTAVGDAVNTTARLAAAAGPGEVLVTTDAAVAAGLDAALPRRRLALKGKQQATEVVSLIIEPDG